jgi:hypothetical protein
VEGRRPRVRVAEDQDDRQCLIASVSAWGGARDFLAPPFFASGSGNRPRQLRAVPSACGEMGPHNCLPARFIRYMLHTLCMGGFDGDGGRKADVMARRYHVEGTKTFLILALVLLIWGLWCLCDGWFPSGKVLEKHPLDGPGSFYLFNQVNAVASLIGAAICAYVHFVVK